MRRVQTLVLLDPVVRSALESLVPRGQYSQVIERGLLTELAALARLKLAEKAEAPPRPEPRA